MVEMSGRKKKKSRYWNAITYTYACSHCPVPCVELYLTALEGRGCMKLARSYNNYSYSYTQLVTEVVKAV